MPLKVVSLALGIFFALFVGLPGIGLGIGYSLWSTSLVIVMAFLLKKKHIWRGLPDWIDLLAAIFLALLPAFFTNQLSLMVGGGALTLYVYFLAVRTTNTTTYLSDENLLLQMIIHLEAFLLQLRVVLKKSLDPRTYRLSPRMVGGLCLSILPLLVFHNLFSAVNSDYAHAIDAIIAMIFDPIIVLRLFEVWLYSVLTYTLLTAHSTVQDGSEVLPKITSSVVTISMLPLLALFGIFSIFQSNAVLVAMKMEKFKELSLYVQQGFHELLIVAVIGYGCWYLVHRKGSDVSNKITTTKVLTFFCVLLFGISLFTAHKLFLLQASFGFKDQRLYASLETLLLTWVFVTSFLHIHHRLSGRFLIHGAVSILLISTATLSWSNVDLLSTKHNPIRFIVADEPRRDLSYLLGNSFDNYSEWTSIMNEGLMLGIATPEDYYWGRYQSLCCKNASSSLKDRVYLIKWHDQLLAKYSEPITSLRQIGAYNIREFLAYRWLLDNDELVAQFHKLAGGSC